MKRSGRLLYLIIIASLGLNGCGISKPDNIKWVSPDRDMKAYYLNDSQCLKQANIILFNQLKSADVKRTKKSSIAKISEKDFSAQTCKTNTQRDRIHYNCMLKKGWLPENKGK